MSNIEDTLEVAILTNEVEIAEMRLKKGAYNLYKTGKFTKHIESWAYDLEKLVEAYGKSIDKLEEHLKKMEENV